MNRPVPEPAAAGLLRYLKTRPAELAQAIRSAPSAPIRPEDIKLPDETPFKQRRRRRRRWYHHSGQTA
jgi:hypothetical protein